ncbi:MAG: hypothetical protein ACRDZT_01830, partial [Acidimicrobiales bacterium]
MTSTVILLLAVFGASSVEMVEALTIVVAAGVSRGWRSAIEGAVVAIVVLAVLVAAVGVPLVHLVPLNALRVIVGGLLLVLGLNWLRKAVLRSSGHKALHDEDAIYARTLAELSERPLGWVSAPEVSASRMGTASATQPGDATATASPAGSGIARSKGSWRTGQRDATGFTVAFKGVFLEGLEVVMIVLTLGSSGRHLGLAAISAAAAVVVVAVIGLFVARQLSEVPENSLKMGVGVMLS